MKKLTRVRSECKIQSDRPDAKRITLTFDFKATFLCNIENLCSDICARSHKVHCSLVIFVPNQMIIDRQFGKFFFQIVQTGCKHALAFADCPHLLFAIATCKIWFSRRVDIIVEFAIFQWSWWCALLPQIGHAQQILDVIVEELVENLFGVVVCVLSPLTRAHTFNVSLEIKTNEEWLQVVSKKL